MKNFYNKNSLEVKKSEGIALQCTLNENDYFIEVGSDGYFNCSNCSKEIQKELKDDYVDFGNIDKTKENIDKYFENKNGFYYVIIK